MLPFILASIGGYLIGSATKDKEIFEEGGEMRYGGDIERGDIVRVTKPNHLSTHKIYSFISWGKDKKSFKGKEFPNRYGNKPIETIIQIEEKDVELVPKTEVKKIAESNIRLQKNLAKMEEGGEMSEGGVSDEEISISSPNILEAAHFKLKEKYNLKEEFGLDDDSIKEVDEFIEKTKDKVKFKREFFNYYTSKLENYMEKLMKEGYKYFYNAYLGGDGFLVVGSKIKINGAEIIYETPSSSMSGGGIMNRFKSGISGLASKSRDLAKAGYEKTKEGIGKAKEYTKKQIHDQKKKIALEVIDDTKDKVGKNNKKKMILKASEEIVDKKYENGGGLKNS